MTEDEMIAVIQSYKDGKRIQCALKDDNRGCFEWNNVSERCGPQWNFQTHIYRVAPEPRKPREFWITPMKYGLCHFSEEPTNDSLWHVREVIE